MRLVPRAGGNAQKNTPAARRIARSRRVEGSLDLDVVDADSFRPEAERPHRQTPRRDALGRERLIENRHADQRDTSVGGEPHLEAGIGGFGRAHPASRRVGAHGEALDPLAVEVDVELLRSG